MLVVRRGDAEAPALRCKLLPPRVPPDLVARPQLLACLERGLAHKLTLIAAPAGYGKTTLLADWLARTAQPAACLTLDETDADPRAFLVACVAALQSLAPAVGQETLALLRRPARPAISYLAATLAAELTDLPRDTVLVLDDYHTLNSADVDELLAALLRHLPPRFHLVLATREDPALPLAQLRARAELAELRADDLRFDGEAARANLVKVGRPNLAPELVARVLERTEGWAAGLRLTALGLGHAADADGWANALDEAERRFVYTFLLDEVFAREEPATQRFLLATAILDRLCAALCAAVLGDASAASAQAMLDRLERRHQFIERLPSPGGWYRLHPQFRDALRARLQATWDAAAVAALHQRASAWLAEQGRVSDALRHAHEARAGTAAETPPERGAPTALAAAEWPQVAEWLRLLPRKLGDGRPAMLMARAWVHYQNDELGAIPPLLQTAAALLSQPDHGAAAGSARGQWREPMALHGAALMEKEHQADGWDPAGPAADSFALVEPLTRREEEVLWLLAARRTNEEIAGILQVAPTTVKKHAMNIYQKLQVNGRRQAVAQAITLGLLPSTPTAEHRGSALTTMRAAVRPSLVS